MRLSAALLVIAHLLLHGVAVPHAHADVLGRGAQAHVHLPWLGAGHDHGHHDGHGQAGHHDHADHDAEPADHEGSPACDDPAPPHDHDAVYLDGSTVVFTAAERPAADAPAIDWFARTAAPDRGSLHVAGLAARFARPPSDAADTPRSLLPHVLRI